MGNTESAEPVRSELPPGADLVKLICFYLGSTPLGMNRSADFIVQAARRIGEMKQEPLPILFRVSDTGLFGRRASNNMLLSEVSLTDLSNVTLVSSNRICFLQRDRKTGFLACHLLFIQKNAAKVCDIINKACSNLVRKSATFTWQLY